MRHAYADADALMPARPFGFSVCQRMVPTRDSFMPDTLSCPIPEDRPRVL